MATWHKVAEDVPFTVRRDMIDRDAQRFIFQCEQFTKSYDPTQAQWNWYKAGVDIFQAGMPNVTGLTFPAYDPSKHPSPGTWS